MTNLILNSKVLTKHQLSMLGKTFKPNPEISSELTVVLVNNIYKDALYTFTCSVCSQDKELWPFGSIVGRVTKIKRGQYPCGCSKTPKWYSWQYKIIAKRVCEDNGYIFEGFLSESNINSTTKMRIRNPLTGFVWESQHLNSISCGVKDPSLKGQSISKAKRKSAEDMFDLEKLSKGKYSFRRSSKKDEKGARTLWDMTCSVCAEDDFSKKGGFGHTFTLRYKSVKDGYLNCRCSDKYRYTEDERRFQIISILESEQNGTFLGFDKKGLKGFNNKAVVLWRCSKEHFCRTGVKEFINQNTRCSVCNHSGFNKSLSGFIYINLIKTSTGLSILKFGITNRNLKSRLRSQTSPEGYTGTTIYKRKSEGVYVFQVESSLKRELQWERVSKGDLPDGHTEAVLYSPKRLDKIREYIDSSLDLLERKGVVVENNLSEQHP